MLCLWVGLGAVDRDIIFGDLRNGFCITWHKTSLMRSGARAAGNSPLRN